MAVFVYFKFSQGYKFHFENYFDNFQAYLYVFICYRDGNAQIRK